MEGNSPRPSKIASDIKYKVFPSEVRHKTANRFPFSSAKLEEANSSENLVSVRHHNYEYVDKIQEVDCLLNTFPMKYFETNCSFPICGYEHIRQIFKPEGQISVDNDYLNTITRQHSFPTFMRKSNKRNSWKVNLIPVKFFQQIYHSTGSFKEVLSKIENVQPSDVKVTPFQFPIISSIMSCGYKHGFPTKMELMPNACVSTMNEKEKHTLSPTMTQSRSFAVEKLKGEAMVEIYTEKQTNTTMNGHEQKKQFIYLHKYNDDELATVAAKNILDSGQLKSCDELPPHIAEHVQYSRSTTKTQCSRKIMDDLEKQHRHQQHKIKLMSIPKKNLKIIKKPSPSPPPKQQSVKCTVRKEEPNFDVAINTQINIPNNLSDINFEHGQQPRSTYLIHSEVLERSSQEDITRNRLAPAVDQSANEASSAFTISISQLTSLTSPIHISATYPTRINTECVAHVRGECQSLFSESVLPNVKSDVFAISSVSAIDGVTEKSSTGSLQTPEITDFVSGADIAMTLTKVEDQKEEDNISVSSSYLDDNQNTNVEEGSVNEMKFEMNGAKSASNVTTQLLASSIPIKTEQRQEISSGSSVLTAATDLSKLANFGTPRRKGGLLVHTEMSTPSDVNNSVLPERTLLRRQRRLQSQRSEDKPEDPIDRLNRLRARISGALSEVKGVLKHYSTDDGTAVDQTPTQAYPASNIGRPNEPSPSPQIIVKEEGPVSFRFVRKVRRRSVFSEEGACEVTKEAKQKPSEVYLVMNGGGSNGSGLPRQDSAKEKEQIELQELNLNGIQSSASENSAARVTNLHQNICKKSEENIELICLGHNEQSTDIALSKVDNQSAVLEAAHLIKTKNEMTPDVSTTEVELTAQNLLAEKVKTSKKRIIKTKGNVRRASIAAVESSQINSPVNAAFPLAVKTHRRPSDSEAIIKRKVKVSDVVNNASLENVSIIIKEKRPPVKKNSTTILKAELSPRNNSTKDAFEAANIEGNSIATANIATAKTAINEPVPKTSDSLTTQLATTIEIDDAHFNCAEKLNNTKTEATQPLSEATYANTSQPTEVIDENGAMVAALASQLRTGEASSHTLNAEESKDQQKSGDHSLNPTATEIEKPIYYCNNADPLLATSVVKEVKVKEAQISTKLLESKDKPNSNIVGTAKENSVSTVVNGINQHSTGYISHKFLEEFTDADKGADKMPELQVTPTPVKPVQVFAENDTGKIGFQTKKTTVKRIVRKNSVDNASEKMKSNSLTTETKQVQEQGTPINDNQLSGDLVVEKTLEITEKESVLVDKVNTGEESTLEQPSTLTQTKKPRKVKRKVIIKRQHRKLSVGDTTFFKESVQPDAPPVSTETLEKAIAYVTDDEDDATEQNLEPIKPIKTCMKRREFEVGDWVMYGERFRKTQIRWKKGQITERITSISYKIKIDDKEVSAHISYIKKYTGRRVNFGGKEYLEIDYEQIAEDERRARTYSIWNMV